jgi:hypothetical protein
MHKKVAALGSMAVIWLTLTASTAHAEKAYLYSPCCGKYSASLDEVFVWKDAASAQSARREISAKTVKNIKCLAKGRSSASVKSRSGQAVEVRVAGSCSGFVNSRYVHAKQHGK